MVSVSVLLLGCYSCMLNGKAGLVGLDVCVESGHIFCGGLDFNTGISREHHLIEVVGQ